MATHELLEEICTAVNEIERMTAEAARLRENKPTDEYDRLSAENKEILQRLDRMEVLMETMTLLLKKISEKL